MNKAGPELVVFAHVPPPEHGQSRMVAALLEALDEAGLRYRHVDARFSAAMEDVGGIGGGKALLLPRYLGQAWKACLVGGSRWLYYVPGPVKWSAVVRDWMVLGLLRPMFGRVVFHWHAIGQGEWAHGSDRLCLPGPKWIDRIARKVSAIVLHAPAVSIVVSRTSDADARAVGSRVTKLVCNGIEDPCPHFESRILPARMARLEELARHPGKPLRVLFLSHGTVEKGILDALEALVLFARSGRRPVAALFAGGVAPELETRFEKALVEALARCPGGALQVDRLGYVSGAAKDRCFDDADALLSPSRWESFGLTIAEAMARGLPVVAAASDGARGVLPENYDLISEVADSEGLARALHRFEREISQGVAESRARCLRDRFVRCFQVEGFRRGLVDALGELEVVGELRDV